MARNQIAIDGPCIAKVEIRRLTNSHFRTLLVPQVQSMSFCKPKPSHLSRSAQVALKWQSLVHSDRVHREVAA